MEKDNWIHACIYQTYLDEGWIVCWFSASLHTIYSKTEYLRFEDPLWEPQIVNSLLAGRDSNLYITFAVVDDNNHTTNKQQLTYGNHCLFFSCVWDWWYWIVHSVVPLSLCFIFDFRVTTSWNQNTSVWVSSSRRVRTPMVLFLCVVVGWILHELQR